MAKFSAWLPRNKERSKNIVDMKISQVTSVCRLFLTREVILTSVPTVFNVLLDNVGVALHLSTRGGFEVVVSEAFPPSSRDPVVSPVRIVGGKTERPITPNNNRKVSEHLFNLLADQGDT